MEREISAERFRIDGVFLFFQLVAVVAPVPDVDLCSWIMHVGCFHFLQFRYLTRELGVNSGNQVVDIFFCIRAGLRHFDFGLEIVP